MMREPEAYIGNSGYDLDRAALRGCPVIHASSGNQSGVGE